MTNLANQRAVEPEPEDSQDDIEEKLLERVLELPREQRSIFLREACASDELRREIVSLLPYAESSRDYLARPALDRTRMDHTEDPAAVKTRNDDLPETIGSFRISRSLGQGATAVVYEAWQESPLRKVALKLLNPGPITTAQARCFDNEATLLARLQHPSIVRIFETGWHEAQTSWGGRLRQPFLVMEHVLGHDLSTHLEAAKLPLGDLLKLFMKICDAVGHAHERGVLHRDLKPSNILVDEGRRPKVLDFGIAQALDTGPVTTGIALAGTGIFGTLAYMSPEQIEEPRGVDRRTDVYSLGVILYRMLSGRMPYELEGRSLIESLQILATTEPTPLETLDSPFAEACRGELGRVVARAMAADRVQRYGSVGELSADLRRYLKD